ncbi:putative NADPH dehydrogenase [Podospora australis]|uniref:NADPH dehydrogenase n=1 Tax=Podospora australis TaxID=1536484 RepID=A0AAN6WWW6_9PEZI|nr:putative NADPH dehydrogenase [Podospora australis]
MTADESNLFRPLKVGNCHLQHRIAMAPLTRFRASDSHVPLLPLMKEYYAQRACVPGTLLITEATFISPQAGGYENVPGIYNPEQISAWKEITDAVHENKSYIFCQLWSLGRAATKEVLEKEGYKVKSSSAVAIDEEHATPEEMTVEEIKAKVQEYVHAAKCAVEAGFDGVEIHGANGYLVDQFLQDTCNKRTDQYGGSVENRARFALEVVDAVVTAVGAERVAIRLSPWSKFQGMRMADPKPQFSYLLKQFQERGYDEKMAYVHFVATRIAGNATVPEDGSEDESLDFAVELFKGPVVIAGGLKSEDAKYLVDKEFKGRDNIVACFGRYFISTPDLVFRVREGIELSPYDRDTFYLPKSARGYTDLPFSKEWERVHGVRSKV